ncbi:DUF4293 family protein [Blattabacterium cuenoti]|uniref:DUF4293 family protein n=1 Tax=Blattabacterium cuenoti TaxID=1653831 RepID=UPI00163CD113|nr:DUF4293 family protein [Blattabacterium cuenoti]
MLYRIQTLYLFISVLIYSIYLYYFHFTTINTINYSIIFVILSLILSILSLLFFKKKKIQIFINKINLLVTNINLILIFYQLFFQLNQFNSIQKKPFFILLFICICNILVLYTANKKIKEDIMLIDSINRIR